MSNDLTYWQDALAGKMPAIYADQPHAGYYKMRQHKDGPFLPVCIYVKDGALVALISAAKNYRPAAEVWTYCADRPVTKEAAMHAFANGDTWPGDAPEAPPIGDNSRDLSLADQVREYASMALGWLRKNGIKDAVGKDTVANMRQKLLDFGKQLDAQREIEKRPHDLAAKAVQAKYKPLIDEATAAAAELRDALTVYMREEEKRLQAEADAKRKAEEERVAAENKRIADDRAKLMRDDPIAALTSDEPEPIAPAPIEPVKVTAGGQRGRKTGLREVTKFRLTDYVAALTHCKDHPAIREAVEKVCFAQARAGASVPGVESYSEKVAA
jgi:hypothetical protein